MSASNKYDLTSSSPDRPLYGSGQRGSYGATSLDKTGNMDNPMLSSLPNMARSSAGAAQGDVVKFFQCLRIDPKAMVTEHKLRQIDFKRLTSLALGVPLEDSSSLSSKGKPLSSSSPEDVIRRLRLGLRESCSKARERVKIFYESSSVFNKCFPNVPTKKRSRSDVLANDRNSALFSTERSVSGTCISKVGTLSHSNMGGFEVEPQKSDERAKTAIPSKRTRTSMSDVRPNTPARPSGNLDRDRDLLRLPNNNPLQGEDRTSTSIAIEGWEKLRMKKKRSGIKADASGNSAASKPVDGYRESKQGMQPRLLTDARSRLSDNHIFRHGANTGGAGIGRTDATSPQASVTMRSSLSKADQDNGLLHDRRDRPIGSEKERINVRSVNNTIKTTAREDLSSGSPTSSAMMNGAARAPRSGVGVAPKLGPAVQRAAVGNDWEVSHCTNKLPLASVASNRKRAASTRSSSPPVGQWAGQRPHKSSRIARRTNFPIVSNNSETTAPDSSAEVVGNERRLSGSSPQQLKLKSDNFSAASESEESGIAETKSKDKSKRSDEVDGKIGLNVQKMSTLLLPPRKSKLVGGDEHSDGVRRQGRSSRNFTSSGSLMPLTVEKIGNMGTAKQLRSSRHSFDKTESKAGRPPTRKLSDRKAYKRQKHSTINAAADFLVGSDDGQEELLAAASDVTNTAKALSSPFWKRMESLFRFISDIDINFLNQQIHGRSSVATPAPVTTAASKLSVFPNGFDGDVDEARSVEFSAERGASEKTKSVGISLYQRLMAAIIPEEAGEELSCSGTEDPKFNVYQPAFDLDLDSELDILHARTPYSSDPRHPVSNGYMKYANGNSFDETDHSRLDSSVTPVRERQFFSDCNHSQNGLLPDEVMSDVFCTEYQYNQLSIDERILLEIQYIGIYPEPDTGMAQNGDEEISGNISRLDQKYQELGFEKNGMLHKLLNYADKTRACQEKDFEQLAFDKLVEMAYKKYMACCGRNAHGIKSGKIAKQAALAFVKRTLERYQEFEETGMSCFNESLFKEIFFSGISHIGDGQIDSITDAEPGSSGEARPSASLGKQQSPSSTQEVFTEGNVAFEVNRVKRRELFLDDVGNKIGTSGMLLSTAKGKRSERDRDGKGNNREVISRNGSTNKIGRPASANNVKGERKPKAKPKPKTTQLSTSLNGLVGKTSEQSKPTGPPMAKSSELSTNGGTTKDKNDCNSEELEDPIDLSGLQLPGMDVLGVPDDIGGQGQDIGSWLNFDDDGLQDHDFMGLEIPMDDLSDLNMMV